MVKDFINIETLFWKYKSLLFGKFYGEVLELTFSVKLPYIQ